MSLLGMTIALGTTGVTLPVVDSISGVGGVAGQSYDTSHSSTTDYMTKAFGELKEHKPFSFVTPYSTDALACRAAVNVSQTITCTLPTAANDAITQIVFTGAITDVSGGDFGGTAARDTMTIEVTPADGPA